MGLGQKCDYCGRERECSIAVTHEGKPMGFCNIPCHEAWRQELPDDEQGESLIEIVEWVEEKVAEFHKTKPTTEG